MQAEQQSEREALRDMIESYGFAFHTAVSIPSMHDKMREKAEGILESILDRAALSHPSPQGWISVLDDLPPDREMVAVAWMDVEDHDHAERYSIDYREDGVWQCYFNEHEHYLIAGVARGNSEDAPYTHWQRIGAIPAPQTPESQP